jgi:ATP-dependent RNA helicase RhlE
VAAAKGAKHDAPHPVRALILTPTRELAAQIGESFEAYGRYTGLNYAIIYGGVKQESQCRALRRGADIVVATPGRLLDLLNQRRLRLDYVQTFVLDEADRMLDMGFIPDIQRIVKLLPRLRQTLLFSATIPYEVQSLASSMTREPVSVEVDPGALAAETVKQCVYYIDSKCKSVLLQKLLRDPIFARTLVFSRTKHGADRIARNLMRAKISAEAIHADKSQGQRTRALANFKEGKTLVLVASDLASRGLDVDDISHVINYDLPQTAETYVHRIGRTGRAGAEGHAISFCSDEQKSELRGIERLLGKKIPVKSHDIPLPHPEVTAPSRNSRPALQPASAGITSNDRFPSTMRFRAQRRKIRRSV